MGWLPQCILQELPDGQRWMLLGLHEAPPAELRFVWICRVVSFQLFRAFWGLELLPGPTRKSRVWGLDQSKKLVHTFCAG